MGYDFYGFNPWDFEELVQALYQKILGNSSLVYGLGADGGRELSYRGPASYASPKETHDGLWIVQAKFRSRDVHDHDQYDWVKTHFMGEMRKFKSGKYPVPDQYIFVTNAVLTPGYQRGGRDKIEELITHFKDTIPRIYVVAYDELCKLLLNNADLRQGYDHFLHPGDQIAEIRRLLEQQAIHKPFVLAGQEIRDIPGKHNYTINLPNDPILTIDFGTSYSLCGVISQRGQVELVPTASGRFLLNSLVTFFKNGTYIVGNSTFRHVSSSEMLNFANIKRELASGRRFDVFGTIYTAEQLATLIIKSLKTSAEEFFGFSFNTVVVAKPANFNLRQTKALREVFERAGLKVRRMLDEGTAPCYLFPKALSERLEGNQSVNFLVVDLGGGTFDLSLQEFSDGVYETKAVIGDNQLGGIDYDKAILDFVAPKMKLRFPQLANVDFSQYLFEAERVKKALSSVEHTSFIIADFDNGDGNLSDLSISITKEEFRQCTSFLNVRIMRCLNDVIRSGNDVREKLNEVYHIDALMLTGQGAKIFTVREIIDNLYPDLPIIDQFMENAVCLGNAYQAGVLQGIVKNELLLSVQNTGLAVMAKDHGLRESKTKRVVFDVAPIPELNIVYGTLLKANSPVPFKEESVLNMMVTDLRQFVILPIFEVTKKGANFESVADLEIPVVKGVNIVILTVDIDANHQIGIVIYNEANRFLKKYQIG